MILQLAVLVIFLAKANESYVLGPIGEAKCIEGTKLVEEANCEAASIALGIEHFNFTAGTKDPTKEKRCAVCGGCTTFKGNPVLEGEKVAKYGSTGDEAQFICELIAQCAMINPDCGEDKLHHEDGAPAECIVTRPAGTECGTGHCVKGKCLELTYGEVGTRKCPKDHSPIEAEQNADADIAIQKAVCMEAAVALGKTFSEDFSKAPLDDDKWACTLCGGCPIDEKPVKFGKNGSKAKYVCKKDISGTRRQLTNRLAKQLEN